MSWLVDTLIETWGVFSEMAPYLLFGFAMAGVLSALVSPEFVETHLGRRGIRQVVKAAILGVPLPLCSCSVIPVTASLRRHGASRGAALSFLASTPQTGLDSIMVTHGLLGPLVTLLRVLTAFLSGVVAGVTIEAVEGSDDDAASAEDAACDCCQGPDSSRLSRILRHGFVTLPREIGRPLVVGIFISGLLSALVPDNYFADRLGPGVVSMLVMMLAGIPLYVCSSGSVPIALALIRMGVSPGAAFVFLVTGPATNAATLATVWKLLGRPATIVYLLTIMAGSIIGGLLLDRVVTAAAMPAASSACHAGIPLWKSLCGGVLLGVLTPAFLPRRWTGSNK